MKAPVFTQEGYSLELPVLEMPEKFRVSDAMIFSKGCLGSSGWLKI